MNRYDRQTRLWGGLGQQRINDSHLLVLGAVDNNRLCQEVVKNLALSGVGSISVLLSCTIDKWHGFYSKESLQSLNNGVEWHFISYDSFKKSVERRYTDFWSKFSIVIVVTDQCFILKLVTDVWEDPENFKALPVLFMSYIVGMYGYVRIVSHEVHCVIEDRHENNIPCLKLDIGFQELDSYCNNLDFEKMNSFQISEIPYGALLRLILIDLPGTPSVENIRAKLRELYHRYDHCGSYLQCLNFVEAEKYAYLATEGYSILPTNIIKAIESVPSDIEKVFDKFNHDFFVMVQAIKKYWDLYKELPLSDKIPDMESGSLMYAEFRRCYEKRSLSDLKQLKFLLDQDLDENILTLFCNNIRNIKTSNFSRVLAPSRCIMKLNFFKDDLAVVLQKMLQKQYGLQYDDDILLHTTKTGNFKKSFCINQSTTAALVAGVLCQEAIKILTHQYEPIENTIIYDGNLNRSAVFTI